MKVHIDILTLEPGTHFSRKDTRNATTERDGKLWIWDHGFSLDNVIYYSHTGRFCFGWRQPVSDSVASKLLDVMSEFPFPYTIKSESKTYENSPAECFA